MANDQLLSPVDLAEMLQIPVGTIYAWRYRGTGPASIKVGRHIRYRRADVDAWCASPSATWPRDKTGPPAAAATQPVGDCDEAFEHWRRFGNALIFDLRVPFAAGYAAGQRSHDLVATVQCRSPRVGDREPGQ